MRADMNSRLWRGAALAGVSVVGLFRPPALEVQIQRMNLAKLQRATSDSAADGKQARFATDGVVVNTNSWVSTGAGPHWLKITLPLPMQLGSPHVYSGSAIYPAIQALRSTIGTAAAGPPSRVEQ